MYRGAVRVNNRQANRMAGLANSNCPCLRYSNQELPTFTKKSTARITSSTGKTTLFTTVLICPCALVQVCSTAPATSPEAAKAGLKAARWPGRLEWCGNVLLDGAHNPQGIAALRQYAEAFLGGRRVVLLTGAMADKDVSTMAREAAALGEAVVCVQPEQAVRALPAEALRDLYRTYTEKPVYAAQDTAAGLKRARELAGEAGVVLVCGSLYLAGEVRSMLGF